MVDYIEQQQSYVLIVIAIVTPKKNFLYCSLILQEVVFREKILFFDIKNQQPF